MKRPGRLSIRTALVAMAGIALALAALRDTSEGWYLNLFLAMGLFFFFLWASVRAILGVMRGTKRAVWIGIVTFGWSFWTISLWLTTFPNLDLRVRNSFASLGYIVHPDLPTLSIKPGSTPEEADRIKLENDRRVLGPKIRRDRFARTLIMLLNLAFALIGGLVGRSVGARLSARPPLANPIGYNREKEAP